MTASKPLVGIITCAEEQDYGTFYKAGDKYIRAINNYADAVPVLIPSLGDDLDVKALFGKLDGILFTGSPSNVDPQIYGKPPQKPETGDTIRDATSLPLLKHSLDTGKPILCICRGHQELNVALGGTLKQEIHTLEGINDHRELQDAPLQESFRPRHAVHLTAGGRLAELNEGNLTAQVNSLHGVAIDEIAPDLFVEAVAEDGIIEACTLPNAKGYVLSVQWHPEHPYALEDPLSRAIFKDFHHAIA